MEATLENLPDDCWEPIVTQLNHHHLESLSLVSRAFFDLTNRLRVSLKVINSSMEVLSKHFQRFPNLKRIDLSSSQGSLKEALHEIAQSQLNLEEINISRKDYPPICLLKEIGSKMKLKVFRCSYSHLTDEDLISMADYFTALEELDISQQYFQAITDEGIVALAKKLKRLQKIDLTGNSKISDHSLITLSTNCKFLTKVVLRHCPGVSEVGISSLMRNSLRMENVVLKMNYRGQSFDVMVEDTDRVLLIDVLNDMIDEAEKQGKPLPTNPTLTYSYMMKSVEIKDDKGLMEMFSRWKERRVFNIWVGTQIYPSHALLMARQVRENRKSNVDVSVGNVSIDSVSNVEVTTTKFSVTDKGKGKLQVRRAPKTLPTHMTSTLTPRRSPRRIATQSSQVQLVDITENSPVTGEFTSPRRSLRLTPDINSPSQISQPLQINQPPNITEKLTSPSRRRLRLTHNSIPTSQITHSSEATNVIQQFKMPKTTAKKRNVYVAKMKDTNVNVDNRRVRRVVRDKVVGAIIEDGGVSDSEGSYKPSDEEVENDEDYSDLEVEDNNILASLEFIDDGYVPFDAEKWYDDEGGFSSLMYNNGELYDDKGFGSIKLRPWMLFMDKEHFKDVLRDYCIQEGFYLIVVKADNSRYTAECATANCQWRIHASVLLDGTTWAIKSINNPTHGCVGVKSHNPMANSAWVANKLIEDIRANTEITGKEIQDLLQRRYGIEMKTSTIYRMKEIAMAEINGGHDESYKKLPAYCEMIKETNPGSYAICSWVAMESPERPLQFKSIFISFNSQFKGVITGCRSLIGVDGTHLKGNHGGVLLAAVAQDGNNELFPIAVSIVESENKDSWSNFFWHLKHCLEESQRTNWTIICDRQKGVEPALESVWPEAYRRFCARHLCKNFKKDYPGVLMYNLFWKVVNATSEFVFKKAMEQVVHHGGLGCARWFLDLGDKELWCKHKFDPTISNDENTSNFVESFNSTLGPQRYLPVLSLLEGVRRVAMVRHATRQQIADQWQDDGITPNIRAIVRVLKKDSRACEAFKSRRGEYEVRDGRTFLKVSLNNHECACGLWQISGIPCKHAIRALITDNKDPYSYVSEWFTVRVYKESYGLSINPIPDVEQWPVFELPNLEPPTMRRSIGRPSRNRRREPGEQRKGKRSIAIRCKKCKCFGHNSKTCKGGYTAKEKNAMQGKVTKTRKKGLQMPSDVAHFDSLEQLESTVMGNEVPESLVQGQARNGKKQKTV